MRIDHVGCAGVVEEAPDGPTVVEWVDLYGSQEASQAGLPCSVAPDLADHRLRGAEGDGLIKQDQGCPLAALSGDEDAGVEDHRSSRWRRMASRSESVTGPSSASQSASNSARA